MKSRRRSLSASRTLDSLNSTAAFVGRIGASLRISARRKSKQNLQKSPLQTPTIDSPQQAMTKHNGWLRFSRLDSNRTLFDSDPNTIDPNNLFGERDDIDPDFGALIPVLSSRSTIGSPQPSSHYGLVGSRSLGARSCPSTPQMQRRLCDKDGSTQLTSLSTLLTHHRHMFLFRNFLVIAKEKAGKSFKFKEKVSLDKLWISSNNCTHSFLIGWPVCNYVAHFNCEREKNEWFEILSEYMNRNFRPLSTTISVSIKIDGMQQNIRKEIQNGSRSSELLAELITELDLPPDPQLYELCYETSTMGIQITHGIENLYAIFMEHISRLGLKLSDSQLAHLDICPLVNCRLILRSSQNNSRTQSTAANLMHQFRKVLISRMDSKRLFGRILEGSMPPQPVLTMIDHLSMNGAQVEGIFRKSPKQATVRELKAQLDQGHVPNFHEFNVHVTASLLKEYLRSIPGQLLLSINFHQWIKVCDESDPSRRLRICRNLLRMLPPSHTVLLKSVLRLMRKISATQQSKMTIRSLAVCIAPSLLENPHNEMVDSVKKIPELAIFLIENAHELFEHFEEEGSLLPPPDPNSNNNTQLHQSTDSGLSDGVVDELPNTNSPDSLLFDSSSSPPLSDSVDDNYKPTTEEMKPETTNSFDQKQTVTRPYQSAFSPRNEKDDSNNFSWSPSALTSRRLNRHGAFRSTLSTSSQSSSPQERSPEPTRAHRLFSNANSAIFSPERNRKNFIQGNAAEDLSVNHRKKESTDSTKTLIARSDSMGSRRLTSPPASDMRSSALTRPSMITSPRTTARRALLSKNETLGLPSINNNNNNSYNANGIRGRPIEPVTSSLRSMPSIGTSSTAPSRFKPTFNDTKPPLPLNNGLSNMSNYRPVMQERRTPFRPPRRTTPNELILGTKVNWSVNSLRSRFQQPDLLPTKIDTLYANFDSLRTPLSPRLTR